MTSDVENEQRLYKQRQYRDKHKVQRLVAEVTEITKRLTTNARNVQR